MKAGDIERLRELLSRRETWCCEGDRIRCGDGNGCECEMAGNPNPEAELYTEAVEALPALLALAEAVQKAPVVSFYEDCNMVGVLGPDWFYERSLLEGEFRIVPCAPLPEESKDAGDA